jgi:RND family efflux transporter MFP subunit
MTINMKSIFGVATAIILTVFSSACGGKHENAKAVDARPTIKATLATAGEGAANGHLSLSGKIQAENYATISARLMGYLTDVKVDVGDPVQKGQLLATIKSDEIQAKMAQAEAGIAEARAGLDNIEKDFARVKSLFEKKSATQKELDDITAAKNMMNAKLKQAQEMRSEVNTMLSYSRITSPYGGTITEKHVNSGDLATPGRPLFTLEGAGEFQAEILVPENQIASIKKGEKVKVILKNDGTEINGAINEFSSSSAHTGGQYLARVDLDKKDLRNVKLYSGMYVNVLLPLKNTANTEVDKIMVHKKAIVEQGQLTGIYTVSENGTAILRWVRLGKSYGDKVEILSGLSSGESYIAEYEGRLMNGVKVQSK